MTYPVLHKSNRIYVFGLKLWGQEWLDNVDAALAIFKEYLPIYSPDIEFSSVKCQSVLSNEEFGANWHVDGVTYKGKTELSIDDIDKMRVSIVYMLNSSPANQYLTYDRIDVVSDLFYEDPTSGY